MAKKILIVDDEPHIVEMLKSRLEANDYKVLSACNGEEGLKKVQDENPGLIILDVMMPEMDGWTFLKELKREGKHIPVIILTAKEKMQDLFELEGIKDYIVKPFKADELLEKISKYFK
ncbi:MAG: response regulator [Chlamydiota bacterium]